MNTNNILKADYLDIIFEGRNKKYGGYELRRKYNRRVTIATIGTLILTCAIFLGKALADRMEKAPPPEPPPIITEVELKEPPPMDKNEPPPPPAPPAPPPPVKPTVQFTPPVITDKPIPEEEKPATVEELKEAPPGPATVAGDPNGIDPGLAPESGTGPVGPIAEPAPDPNKIVDRVDQPASFPGLYDYLAKHLTYPDAEREAGNEGKVFVQFVVNVDGSIQDVKVARSSGYPALDAEALRVVRRMPAWKPGLVQGKPVRSIFKQPVTFRLN